MMKTVMHFISGVQSGGVEQFLYNYTIRLNENFDIKEYVVYQHEADNTSLTKLTKAGNICIRIPSKAVHPVKNFIETFKLIYKIHPDVVHCHMNLFNWIPLLVAFFLNVKIRISHSHIATDNINSKMLVYISKNLNICFSNIKAACGKAAGEYMYGNRKFTVIKNAIEVGQFKFDPIKRKQIRNYYNISDNDFLIGNVGRFTKQKNQKFLINLMSNLVKSDIKYRMFIIGQGEMQAELQNQIKSLSLAAFIDIVPPMTSVASYYDAMDLFLLPSLYEGFPVVSVEVQAAGLPFIISDTIDETSIFTKLGNTSKLDSISDWHAKVTTSIKSVNRFEYNHVVSENFDIESCYHDLWDLYNVKQEVNQ